MNKKGGKSFEEGPSCRSLQATIVVLLSCADRAGPCAGSTAWLMACQAIVALGYNRQLQFRVVACLFLVIAGGQGNVPCIKHITPGSPLCSSSTTSYGYLANKGPGQATLQFTQSSKTCPSTISGSSVGSITTTCPTGSRAISFTLRMPLSNVMSKTFVLLSCTKPTATTVCPGAQWLSVGSSGVPAVKSNEAGNQVVKFNVTLGASAACNCSSAYWAVYSTGTFTGLAKSFCN